MNFSSFVSPVLIGGGTIISPTRTGRQGIGGPKGHTSPVELRNAQLFHTSINRYFSENWYPAPAFSKGIGQELYHNSSADIYSRCRVNFMHDAVGTNSPNFMNLWLLAVHTSNELGSFSTPATRVKRPVDGSNYRAPGHVFGETTAVGVSGTRSELNHSSITYFETRIGNQHFERHDISMSQPTLESTPFGMNATNRTTSQIDWIPVGTKIPYPTPLTRTNDLPTRKPNSSEQKRKGHVPADRESDPSSSNSPSNKSNLLNDTNFSKSNKKKRDKKKILKQPGNRSCQTHLRLILIRPTTVTTDASDAKIISIRKMTLLNHAHG